jgi:hypothetical protein
MMRSVCRNSRFRPLDWLVFSGRIGEDIAVTLVVLPNHDNAGLVGIFPRGRRGVDRDHNSCQVWG